MRFRIFVLYLDYVIVSAWCLFDWLIDLFIYC